MNRASGARPGRATAVKFSLAGGDGGATAGRAAGPGRCPPGRGRPPIGRARRGGRRRSVALRLRRRSLRFIHILSRPTTDWCRCESFSVRLRCTGTAGDSEAASGTTILDSVRVVLE